MNTAGKPSIAMIAGVLECWSIGFQVSGLLLAISKTFNVRCWALDVRCSKGSWSYPTGIWQGQIPVPQSSRPMPCRGRPPAKIIPGQALCLPVFADCLNSIGYPQGAPLPGHWKLDIDYWIFKSGKLVSTQFDFIFQGGCSV